MPLQTIKLLPGVNAEVTKVLGEAQIVSTQLVRFKMAGSQALVEKLGGWSKYFGSSFGSTVRALHAWEGINSDTHLAIGAVSSLSVLTAGVNQTITPQTTTSLKHAVNFSTVNGSKTVTIVDVSTATVTITIASPAVITWTANGLSNGDPVYFTTTGTLPTGITANTVYYVVAAATNTFEIATSVGGTPINTSGSQSGVQSAFAPGIVPSVFDSIFLLTPVAIGGLVLEGAYQIASVVSNDSYTITAASAATATVNNGGAVPVFGTTSGTPNVNVLLTGHGEAVGDTFPVPVATTVGGITISGAYIVQTIVDANNFTIFASSSATSTTTGAMNGGNVAIEYFVGVTPSIPPAGYGVSTYGAGGYGIGVTPAASSGTAITATNWTLDNWGEVLLACPANGPIYTWSPDSGFSTAIKLLNGPLINGGIFVVSPAQILVAWASSINGVQDPLLVQWSDSGDYTNWSVSALTQAGNFHLPTGSKIVGGLMGPQFAVIWTDLDVWSMDYIGTPLIFGFNNLARRCGLIGRHAACVVNASVLWMGLNQFFIMTGGSVRPIPCPVWDVVFQDLDTANLDKICCASNNGFGEVAWYYPSLSGGTGEVDSYVKFNFNLDTWDFGKLVRTAWIDQSVLGEPIGGDASGFIYQHEISPDADGAPMMSSFSTGYFAIGEGDDLSFLDWGIPDFVYGTYGDTTPNAALQISLKSTDYPGQAVKTQGPFNVNVNTTFINPRLRGRFVSLSVGSSDVGSFWRIGGIKFRITPDGKR